MGGRSGRARAVARAALATALLLLSGCTTSGKGKAAKPVLKVFKFEHPQAAPPGPIRSGALELRISKVFLEENRTVFQTSYWAACLRGAIVSPEALPISALSEAFTLIGKSGQVYRGHVRPLGSGHPTWQHQVHTGEPTHLPANVAGELEVSARVGDKEGHDEVVAFTFQGLQVPLAD